MKPLSSVVRVCIPAGVALAALALHPGHAASQPCPATSMAVFEADGGISAMQATGSWLRILPRNRGLVTMATVEGLAPCAEPEFRVSPDGTQLITWPGDDEILSVTTNGTVATRLPEGKKLWDADVAFLSNGLAVVAALLYEDMEEPQLALMVDERPGKGELEPPFSVTGADCRSGIMAAGTTQSSEVIILCDRTFTVFVRLGDSYQLATLPLDLGSRHLVAVARVPRILWRVTFFAIVKDESDPLYELVRIRLNPDGEHQIETLLYDVAYAGGEHGLAAIDDLDAVYMDEQGLMQVAGSTGDTWSSQVIDPLRREARLSATFDPLRVIITDEEVRMLTLSDVGWEYTTLFGTGAPPAPQPVNEAESGCSMAGGDPATGLGQVLLVMLALVASPWLARGRAAAHDGASWRARSSKPR